jgi:hypothetical protein
MIGNSDYSDEISLKMNIKTSQNSKLLNKFFKLILFKDKLLFKALI